MAPDVNSLPPSSSISPSPNQGRPFPPAPGSEPLPRNTPSPRPSVSLAAAATLNAADRTITNEQGSPAARRASARRRSNVAMGLQLNDPTLPSPGELASGNHRASISNVPRTASPTNVGGTPAIATGDPHHHQRAPSLGEIHQELEQEQEAQVNRLLQMIRIQQSQLQQLQSQQGQSPTPQAQGGTTAAQPSSQSISTAIDDSTPTSERSFSLPVTTSVIPTQPAPAPASSLPHRSSLAGRRLSQSPSPALRPLPRPPSFLHQPYPDSSAISSSTSDFPSPSETFGTSNAATRRTSRDEITFYQAETANLTRENQMLRHRIKELEKQLVDKETKESNTTSPVTGAGASTTAEGNPSVVPTNLSREVSVDEEGQSAGPSTD